MTDSLNVPQPWHTLAVDEALARLATTPTGLDAAEAGARLAQVGPNRIAVLPPTPWWTILAMQFRSVVVALLAVAAIAAAAVGEPIDSVAIVAVLAINATLGFLTEWRARRAMEALRQLEAPRATVLRGGNWIEIDAVTLVPGDIIALDTGQTVPADARLIASTDLRATEASLTGESLPTDKRAAAVLDAGTVLAERVNMVFQSTTVVAGTARAVVVATGSATEVGRIGTLVGSVAEERTPLEQRLDALGRHLVWMALAIAAAVAAMGFMRGDHWSLVLQTGVALAIAAVPEGLPAVATIALAVGVWRMARRRALVRRLAAVEALGASTVVCTDKTGTLTAGAMAVTTIATPDALFEITGTSYEPTGAVLLGGDGVNLDEHRALRELLIAGMLANRAGLAREDGRWQAVGDPTEAALLVAGRKAGLERDVLRRSLPEIAAVPFSSDRQWMATFHRTPNDDIRLYVKGAPRRVLDRCSHVLQGSQRAPLDDAGREALLEGNRVLAARGLRVLALARSDADPRDVAQVPEDGIDEALVQGLTFLGLAGLADPPADLVPETIRALHEAGIRTIMITGDQQRTAEAVADQLGLRQAHVPALGGRELAALDDDALATRLADTNVFSRVSPADKLRIVDVLRRSGEIVAMLGDGVNDAAALRKADIGVAMGERGTDIAKEAADIVLADDRFVTVAAAVEEGRVIFDNIRKFVFYLFSCNLAEVLVLLVAGLAALPQPLLPLQLLWLNLVTDTFPALALAVEPAEPDVMRRPPRDPQEAILSMSFLGGIAFYAGLIAATTLAAFLLAMERGDDMRAGTIAFVTLALAQAFHLGNARSRHAVLALRRAAANRWAVGSVVLVVGLQLAAVHVPALARVLRVVPLTALDWMQAIAFASVPAIVGQVVKLRRR